MSRYLPQESYIVCTNQMDPSPNTILADASMWNRSVVFQSEKQPLLTEVDKNLKDDFECKDNWGTAAVWSFLAAGVALGLAVAFSVCTLGVGAVILGAVAVTATVIIASSNSTKCNPSLVKWKNPHPSVNFESHKALTQKSFLTCSVAAGILTPFINKEDAEKAAQNVAYRNWGDVSLRAAISGLFGYAIGLSGGIAFVEGGGIAGLIYAGGKEAFIGIVGAQLIYQPIEWGEKKLSQDIVERTNSDLENEAYDSMLSARKELEGEGGFKIDSPDDPYLGYSQGKAIQNVGNETINLYRQNQNRKYINQILNVHGTQAEKKAKVAEIVTKLNKTRSGAQAVEAMKGKQSGEIWTRNPKYRKMKQGLNQIDTHKSKSKMEVKNALKEGLIGTNTHTEIKGKSVRTSFKGQNAIGLILPLLVSPLNEWTFNILAGHFANQSSGGATINSTQH